MNPENCGPHIVGRHSYLWRNSMFTQKPISSTQPCHHQLNEFSATMSQSWRTRNNFIRTNDLSGFKKGSSLRNKKSQIEDVLGDEKMQTKTTKSLVKSLLIDKDQLEKSAKLIQGMSRLKEMNLLVGKDLNNVKLPGVIKHPHIYNDYHTRGSNPGYSRGELGRHYAH